MNYERCLFYYLKNNKIKRDTLNEDMKEKLFYYFISGKFSFTQIAKELGLTHTTVLRYIPHLYWDGIGVDKNE